MKKMRLISFGILALFITLIFGCSLTNQSLDGKAGSPDDLNLSVASAATTYGKVMIPGVNTSDPQARIFNGKIYLYVSSDLNAPGTYPMSNTYVYTSTDEVHWTGKVILHENDYSWVKKSGNHLWAPDCIYKNGKYWLYVPDNDTGGTSRIGISTSANPDGPFTPLSTYFQGITGYASDPGVFIDDDGTPYMVYCTVGYSGGRTWIVKMNTNMIQANGTPAAANVSGMPNSYTEGGSIFKFNGKYYLIGAIYDNGGEAEWYAMATSVTGPYTYKGHIMEKSADEWTIQASIIQWNNHYSFYYHDKLPTGGMKRQVMGEYLKFNADGTIPLIVRTSTGLTN